MRHVPEVAAPSSVASHWQLHALLDKASGPACNADEAACAQVLRGHKRPVSYVRWMGRRVVTASVDSSLAWWDLQPSQETLGEPSILRALREQGLDPHNPPTDGPLKIRAFRGHANAKNFAGLAVQERDGLLACGSECGSAFVYHKCWSSPLASLPVGWPNGLGVGSPPRTR